MNSKITYHQQVSYCGKPRCRKCREGTGHGPYWYAYQTVEGKTTRTYVGKNLPPDVQASMEGTRDLPVPLHEQEQEQALLRIHVLGQFRIDRRSGRNMSEWQPVTDSAWQHQRVRALLGCLVSSAGRKLGREQIMDALWPDLDLETAASRLDRAVYSLRQLFEPSRNRPATSPFLLTEREQLLLADQSQVWIDADAFEQLLIRARESSDPGEQERLLDEAVTLYGGDFLPEERRVEWTLGRRESLQRSWIGLLLDLARLRIDRDALNSAIDPLDRLLSVDPTNEAAVQRLMKLLYELGRRGEALRAYKRLAQVLQQEYRIAPLPETRAIYEALRSGNTAPVVPSAATATQVETRREMRPDAQIIQIGRTHQSPLVGRDEELSVLRNMVLTTEHSARFRLSQRKTLATTFDSTQRRAQCMLLMGDVGIGKTRLAEEVSRDAKRRNWAVAWSRVYAQEGSIPYRLWTEVLRKAMAQGAWQRQELSRRPLVFQPLGALLPELYDLLPPVSFSAPQSPEQEQLHLWEASHALLTLICESTPLLIALDDLQWADASSCELLAYLARRIYGHSIVIVGTCRDNELPPTHALRPLLTDLQREHAVETLPLHPLSDEQIGALVTHISSHVSSRVTEPLVQHIRDRAAGNPFFAEELARTITLPIEGTNGSSPPPVISSLLDPDGEAQLPDTINAVLDLRLNRLSTSCLRLLNKAAVLGNSFEFPVINAMEAITPGSNEDIVLDLLEEALKSGMLTEEGVGTRITYQFWHPLLVDHLYVKLSAARRASLHRRAADIFQRLYEGREEEGAVTITHHLVQGGAAPQKIARFAELAGNRSYSFSSYGEAEGYYRIAIENLNIRTDDPQHYAYLLELLGECTHIQGKYDDARGFYEKAFTVHGHQSISSTNPQQEAQLQAMLSCEIGYTWFDTGNNPQAQYYYQQSEQILQDAGIINGLAWAYLRYRQSYVSWRKGNYNEARATANEALRMFEDSVEQLKKKNNIDSHLTRIRRILLGDPVNLGRVQSLLGLIANGAGKTNEALSYLNMALSLYEQYDRQQEIVLLCCNLGDLYIRKAEYAQAHAVLRRSLNLAERIGDIPNLGIVIGNIGILDARTANLAEAENECRRAITLAENVNDTALVSNWCSYLATYLQEQNRLSEAKVVLCRALRISSSMRITPYMGIALVALGSMRIHQALNLEVAEKSSASQSPAIVKMLRRAKKSLSHALALEGIEAETRVEGQLLLAQTSLLLGEPDLAYEQTIQGQEDAIQSELTWLVGRAQRLLGCIFASQNRYEQAEHFFDQAIRTFRKCGMRLEYARALYHYGLMLLQWDKVKGKKHEQGIAYLKEACQTFSDCKAKLDLKLVKRALAEYE
jgi:predicted ATPase/DNA-binding SARP family transcriptional activator